MLDAGYAKIGEFDQVGAGPTSGLLVAGAAWRRKTRVIRRLREPRSGRRVRVLQVGYEADVGDEEKWLTFYPDSGELDVISWRDTLEGHADWDVWHDRLVSDDKELERRLVALGSALRERPSS